MTRFQPFPRTGVSGHAGAIHHLSSENGWALNAQGMTVGYAWFLGNSLGDRRGFTANGGIRLTGVTVNGFLSLRGAHITADQRGTAISGHGLNVASELLMDEGFEANGLIYFGNLTVGDQWRLDEAHLANPGNVALFAQQADIRGSITCTGAFACQGDMDLSDATIGQTLDLTGATVTAGTEGLVLAHSTLRRLTLRGNTAIDDVDLRHTTIEVLDDAPTTGPQRLRLQAAAYETTRDTSAATVPDRLAWLDRDPMGYSPQPYDHLAAMYLRAGEPEAARMVKIASLRRRRRALPMPGRIWNWLLDYTVGYGYRPWLAGLWLVVLTVPSAIYFAHSFPVEFTGAVDRPASFQPLIYTLDTLLPVIDFGQSSSWHPNGPAAWLSWTLITLGWVLTTSLAAGVARALSGG